MKIINENQLRMVLLGFEKQLLHVVKDLKLVRHDNAEISEYDIEDIRKLLKQTKDAAKFTKRCIKEFVGLEEEQVSMLKSDHCSDSACDCKSEEEEDWDCPECDTQHHPSYNCDSDPDNVDDDEEEHVCDSDEECTHCNNAEEE